MVMNYLQALNVFTRDELRAIAKLRGLRYYSYLTKRELSFRLFGMNAAMSRTLCAVNQLRRYKVHSLCLMNVQHADDDKAA